MNENDPWKGLLDPDENIIWQGAPAPGVQLEWKGLTDVVGAIFFVGFGIFWLIQNDNSPLFFRLVGLLPLAAGLYRLLGVHFEKAYRRRTTFYTLTSKRAFIGYKKRGMRKLDSYPIGPDSNLTIEESTLSNIWFETKQTVERRGETAEMVTVKIGFERLENGREVLAKFRDVQNATVKATAPVTE